jgi:transposase
MSMAGRTGVVIGGVDTHKRTHHAAVIDSNGRLLDDREFSTDGAGEVALLAWLRSHGTVDAVGIEGTGSYGAALTKHLTASGVRVVEVNRPNRAARRADGKSDQLDAEQAARAVLAATATAVPKSKCGTVEVIRMLRVTRSSAVKARTQAFLTLHGIMIGAPTALRDELVKLSKRTLVNRCARLRPETEDLLELINEPDRLQLAAAKRTLRDLARRWLTLDIEIKALSAQIKTLVERTAPELVNLYGVGTEIAASSSSPPAKTPKGSTARKHSPSSAASHHNPQAAEEPPDATDSAGAETAPRTAPSTSSRSPDSADTSRHAPTSPDAPPKASPSERSSAASSATSPARCSQPCHASTTTCLLGPLDNT